VTTKSRLIHIPADNSKIQGDLSIPENSTAIVAFAHGSGSSRHSPRNKYVAGVLNEGGMATLLIDLLTADEEVLDVQTAHLRFNIDLLAERLSAVTKWLQRQPETEKLHIGYFGASTGAAAALVAAAKHPEAVKAVVSRGGRPDLAGPWLLGVRAPTLLILGGDDHAVIKLNREAASELRGEHHIEIIPRAGHLFEEPGALERVAKLARNWFEDYLVRANQHAA
jgi:putative phosphoribosyl transferase